jgi:hypothetical protein
MNKLFFFSRTAILTRELRGFDILLAAKYVSFFCFMTGPSPVQREVTPLPSPSPTALRPQYGSIRSKSVQSARFTANRFQDAADDARIIDSVSGLTVPISTQEGLRILANHPLRDTLRATLQSRGATSARSITRSRPWKTERAITRSEFDTAEKILEIPTRRRFFEDKPERIPSVTIPPPFEEHIPRYLKDLKTRTFANRRMNGNLPAQPRTVTLTISVENLPADRSNSCIPPILLDFLQ